MSEEITDVLDDLTSLDYDQEEQSKLEEKYKPRTQVDVNEPFYNGSYWTIAITQFFSVLLGLGLCINLASKFPQVGALIFLITLVLLILWEFAKRKVLSKIDEIRIINKSKKVKLSAKPYALAAVFLVVGSMGAGYIGAPEVIEEFSRHEPLAMIEDIRGNFEVQIEGIKKEFKGQKIEAFSLAAKLHEESNWRGTTSKDVRKEKAKLILLGASKDTVLNTAVLDITEDMNEAVKVASIDNKKITDEHKEWCYSFGLYASIGNILLDVILIILCRWMSSHEDRKMKLNKKKKELQEKDKDTPKEGVNTGEDPKDDNLKDKEILKGEGRKGDTISVTLSDGNMKAYTFGKFRNYFKNSSVERQEELQVYLDEIEAFEFVHSKN